MRRRDYKPGDARLPRIAYADGIPFDYAREWRRRRRVLVPVVAVLVAVRYRTKSRQRQGRER